MMYVFLSWLGCTSTNEPNINTETSKATVPSISKQSVSTPVETQSIRLGSIPSPLNTMEILSKDFPTGLKEEHFPLEQGFDETVALSNLLRGPCVEDWEKGRTLNQSLLEGNCQKAVDWFKEVQTSVNNEVSSEDILFSFVAPGPYYTTSHSDKPMIIVTFEQSQSELLKKRLTMFETLSSDSVVIFVKDEDGLIEFDRECLLSGQKKTIAQAKARCKWQNAESRMSEIRIEQSPLWVINGYAVTGFRSAKQLQSLLDLP